eukprot:snap_masked-scaffold_3-processed-gene-2.23-mRNA-1 protein AED:1.00 eAED:1.00 QI:0/-1/0/0/-1/1/1/0/396
MQRDRKKLQSKVWNSKFERNNTAGAWTLKLSTVSGDGYEPFIISTVADTLLEENEEESDSKFGLTVLFTCEKNIYPPLESREAIVPIRDLCDVLQLVKNKYEITFMLRMCRFSDALWNIVCESIIDVNTESIYLYTMNEQQLAKAWKFIHYSIPKSKNFSPRVFFYTQDVAKALRSTLIGSKSAFKPKLVKFESCTLGDGYVNTLGKELSMEIFQPRVIEFDWFSSLNPITQLRFFSAVSEASCVEEIIVPNLNLQIPVLKELKYRLFKTNILFRFTLSPAMKLLDKAAFYIYVHKEGTKIATTGLDEWSEDYFTPQRIPDWRLREVVRKLRERAGWEEDGVATPKFYHYYWFGWYGWFWGAWYYGTVQTENRDYRGEHNKWIVEGNEHEDQTYGW